MNNSNASIISFSNRVLSNLEIGILWAGREQSCKKLVETRHVASLRTTSLHATSLQKSSIHK